MEEENKVEASSGALGSEGKDEGGENVLAKMAQTFDIPISNRELAHNWNRELDRRRRNFRMPGYRPGKAPIEAVRATYGDETLRDAVFQLLGEGLGKAKEVKDWDQVLIKRINKGLPEAWDKDPDGVSEINVTCQPAYVINFLKSEKEFSLPRIQIVEADNLVERTIAKLVGQFKEHTEAPEGAGLEKGDLANITSKCEVDGETFPGATVTDSSIEIGDQEFFGVTDQLLGMKVGETRKFEAEIDLNSSQVVMAENPGEVKKMGKASFEVTLNKILNPEQVEIDDNFVKRLDPETNLKTFEAEVGKNVRREIDRRLYLFNMRRLISVIMENIKIDFDSDHVNQEYNSHLYRVWGSGDNRKKYKTLEKFVEHFHSDNYHEWFVYNTMMTWVFNRLNAENDIKLSEDEVKEFVEQVAETFDDPETYKKNALSSPDFVSDANRVLKFRKLLEIYMKRSDEVRYMSVTGLYNFFRSPNAKILEYYRIY